MINLVLEHMRLYDSFVIIALGCRTLLATHFHELSRLSNVLDHAGCYHVTANQDSNGLAFDYKVKVTLRICCALW